MEPRHNTAHEPSLREFLHDVGKLLHQPKRRDVLSVRQIVLLRDLLALGDQDSEEREIKSSQSLIAILEPAVGSDAAVDQPNLAGDGRDLRQELRKFTL